MADEVIGNEVIAVTKPKNFDESPETTGLYTLGYLRSQTWLEQLPCSVFTSDQGLIRPIKTNDSVEALKVHGKGKPFIRISDADDGVYKDNGSVTIAMRLALNGDGFEGREQPEGNEETRKTRELTISANLVGNALSEWNLGIDKLNQEWVKTGAADTSDLSQWMGERTDKKIHQAFCETISLEQVAAPSSLTASINPNIIYADVAANPATNGRVVYAPTGMPELVGDAAALTTDANNHCTVDRFITIGDQCTADFKMRPIAVNGGYYFLAYMCPEEKRKLKETQATGSYGANFLDVASFAEVKKVVPTATMVIDQFIIIEDVRNADLEIGGADGTWTTTFGYVGQGGNSTRATSITAKKNFNVNIICGQDAMLNYNRQGTSFAENLEAYGWRKGNAIYDISSYSLPIFDVSASKTATTIRSYGSCLLLTAKESLIGSEL